MQLSDRIKKAVRIYRKEGVASLYSTVRGFFSHRFTWRYLRHVLDRKGIYQSPYHKRIRTDSLDRWEMVQKYLNSDYSTALDIGCASGYFTAKLAEEGYFCVGIDMNEKRLTSARRIWGDIEGVAFMNYTLNPNNIGTIPSFDVVVLFTVYHHWCDVFGRAKAEDMLRELGSQSRLILFEPPGRNAAKFDLVGDEIGTNESIGRYYLTLIEEIFDNEVDVEYIGDAAYPHEIYRSDPLFVINCEGFARNLN